MKIESKLYREEPVTDYDFVYIGGTTLARTLYDGVDSIVEEPDRFTVRQPTSVLTGRTSPEDTVIYKQHLLHSWKQSRMIRLPLPKREERPSKRRRVSSLQND